MARLSVEFIQGFLARLVEVPAPAHFQGHGPCRLWSGATTGDGHGKLSLDGRTVYAHRIAFELAHGREPGPLLRHLCGRASCANDAHLREGSGSENLADSVAHGTYSPPPVMTCESHPSSKLRTDDVRRAMDRLERGEATQQEIADELGIAQSRVSQIFNGQGWRCR